MRPTANDWDPNAAAAPDDARRIEGLSGAPPKGDNLLGCSGFNKLGLSWLLNLEIVEPFPPLKRYKQEVTNNFVLDASGKRIGTSTLAPKARVPVWTLDRFKRIGRYSVRASCSRTGPQ